MYRKYIDNLIKWNNNPDRKPLIIWGARQVGKTYLIKELFAKKYFKNFIYIDCKLEVEFARYCLEHINPKDIINYLSLKFNIEINKDILLIFDEVQECLPLVTSLKYFNQDYPEFKVIITGSMVRMKINKTNKSNRNFLFPVGNINQLIIYPLNFEEYLYNKNKKLYDYITNIFSEKKALENIYHKKALEIFYEYLLIGGMPEVVNNYLSNKSMKSSLNIISDIYDNYLMDMSLYQISSENMLRTVKIFDSIYFQLNKENKNFKPSLIKKNFKNRDLLSPIDWLSNSFLINKSFLIKEKVSIPLIKSNDSLYRIYLADMGIFSYQSKQNAVNFISNTTENTLKGIFFENYVAQELVNFGHKLFYWKGKKESEIEFLIEDNDFIIPIEVKKNKGKFTSLNHFKELNKFSYAVKVSSQNFGYDRENKVYTIPFYMFFLWLKSLTI